ncbi:hypothetical protein NQ317_016360 [Molorchus minor]|uniref:Reverse transcriptase domain-containing protein n=1 Tax=Molorchus minor TaxID=1323400 RepID=A0ABQ9JEE2_9CUCU|nr:hypothetical protein NQ317_016360 [Molorchus minor]
MEDARTASKLIRPGNFAATLDLKDAYYSLPILKDHRKYLRFCFRNTLYEFTCLPFGLASAPYTFSKLMRPVVEFLRSRDVLCNIRLATNNLHRDHFDLEISTDASLSGWGAYCQGESVSGWWSVEDKTHHINILELKAIFFGLKCFAKDLNCRNILIRTDNTTALALYK